MKKIIILLLFSIIKSNSQNLYLEYGVVIHPEKSILEKDEMLKAYYLNAIDNAKYLNFGLLCTEKDSKFFNINDEKTLRSLNGTDLIFTGYSGVVYDLKDYILAQSTLLGNNIYVKKERTQDWLLTNDQKEINGYICYKATNVNVIKYGEKTFNHPVIAWYCPQIPYSYGPNGYSNLPGLILELQVRNVVFGVKKILLDTKENFKVKKQKMKILTEDEFENALDKFNDFDTK